MTASMAPFKHQKRRRRIRTKHISTKMSKVDIDIIAYLDSSMRASKQQGSDLETFDQCVVLHLHKFFGHDLTLPQINRKIRATKDAYSMDGYDIRRQGSESLVLLDEKTLQEIHDRSRTIDLLKLQDLVQTPVKVTRSRSKADKFIAGSHVSLMSEPEGMTSSRKKRLATCTPRDTPLEETSQSDSLLRVCWTPSVSISSEGSHLINTPVPFSISENGPLENGYPQRVPFAASHQLEKGSENTVVVQIPRRRSYMVDTKSEILDNMKDLSHLHTTTEIDVFDAFDRIISENTGKPIVTQIEALRVQTRARIDSLEQRVNGLEKVNSGNNEQDTIMGGTCSCSTAEFCGPGQIFSKQLEDMQVEIQQLEQNLERCQVVKNFMDDNQPISATSDEYDKSLRRIKETADQIWTKTSTLFCEGEIIPNGDFSCWEREPRLMILLQRSLGTKDASELQLRVHQLLKSTDTLRLLLRSLMGSALYMWVFDECITELQRQHTILIDEYRELISGQVSAEIATALDFAAHQYLFRNPAFKEIAIDDKARELARLFLQSISRITTLELLGTNAENETVSLDWTYEQDVIQDVFALAINLKLLVALSQYDLCAIFCPPKLPYNSSFMHRELSSFGAGRLKEGDKHLVKLGLLPALWLLKTTKPVVEPYSFVAGDPNSGEAKRVLLVKASVVFGEEQTHTSFIADSDGE